MQQITCPTCHGSGALYFNAEETQHRCPTCDGSKVISLGGWLQRVFIILVVYLLWGASTIYLTWSLWHLPE